MSRRGKGEGSVRKVNNSWVAKVQIGWKDNGTPKIKSFSASTRNQALKRMRHYMDATKNADNKVRQTLAEAMEYWLANYKSLELKDSSYNRLECTIENNVIPYIGHYMADEVTSEIIQTEVINTLVEANKSYSTVRKAYLAINGYYKHALVTGAVDKNPVLGVTLPSQKLLKPKKSRWLTKDEQDKFIKQALFKYTNGKERYRYGRIYIFMMYTGLRCSEMLGLTWEHIDMENKTVTVEQSLVTVKSREDSDTKFITKLQDSTKTISGKRIVPLSNRAIEAIAEYKERYYTGNPRDFVVLSNQGNPLKARHFQRSANYIYKAAGINASGVHILRHTFASMLFDRKIDIKIISKMLGHSDVSTTYNIYIHLTETQTREAIDSLNEL